LNPNAFLRIAPSVTVMLLARHSEVGRGIHTSRAMCVAEDLEAEWTKIVVEAAPSAQMFAHTAFGTPMTGGRQAHVGVLRVALQSGRDCASASPGSSRAEIRGRDDGVTLG
jgi:CO/xanthine dehydrogenase Mo-binding subunit